MVIHQLSRALVVGLTLLMLGMGGVQAHSALVTATPANNDVLSAPPSEVRMSFNEPVNVLSAVLLGPDGQKRDLTETATGGPAVVVPLPRDLPQGTEALTWRIVSTDGHPVSGTLVFSIGKATGETEEVQADPALAGSIWLARVLLYIGMFVGVGGAVFGAVAPPPMAARRISLGTIGVGAIAAIIAVGLQGADGLGTGLTSLLSLGTWRTGAGTTYVFTIIGGLLAFAAALVSFSIPGVWRTILAALALALVGGALASSGHASAADPQWLTRPAVVLHTAAVCFWIGSLVPLGMLLARGGAEAETALRRFSDIIPVALFPLVLAGLALAIVQLGPFGPAWLTPYAAILGGKLFLVIALFLLAAWNRWRLTKPALQGGGSGRRRMAVSVRAEIVLVLVILGLVAGLRFTTPPRAVAEELAVPAQAQLMAGKLMAEVTVLPGRVGQTAVTVSLTDMQMAPVKPLSVKLAFEQKAAGVGPIGADATLGVDGTWHAASVLFPIGGAWTVTVEARTGKFDLSKLSGTLEIQ